ncbi:MAG: lipoprotein [Spiroplasma phoeniceum]|nr:MAG: lipoprotein [Spiroplasma phoeniceum]UZQ31382.1 MAG: lipoprotein [Spiroplasma phoeniceum]
MKKLLSIIGAISLIGTGTTNLVACNTPQYSEDELKKEKEKNNITTKYGILEWIEKQEKPFTEVVDNKWYYIIYKDNYKNIKLSKRINNNPNVNINFPWSNSWIKVYRWNGEEQKLPNLDIDKDGKVIVKE